MVNKNGEDYLGDNDSYNYKFASPAAIDTDTQAQLSTLDSTEGAETSLYLAQGVTVRHRKDSVNAWAIAHTKYKGRDFSGNGAKLTWWNDVSAGEDTNILSYDDAQDISEYAIPAMQWACVEGLITGKPGNLLNP